MLEGGTAIARGSGTDLVITVSLERKSCECAPFLLHVEATYLGNWLICGLSYSFGAVLVRHV